VLACIAPAISAGSTTVVGFTDLEERMAYARNKGARTTMMRIMNGSRIVSFDMDYFDLSLLITLYGDSA